MSKKEENKTKRNTNTTKICVACLIVILIIAGCSWLAYSAGNKKGVKEGKKEAVTLIDNQETKEAAEKAKKVKAAKDLIGNTYYSENDRIEFLDEKRMIEAQSEMMEYVMTYSIKKNEITCRDAEGNKTEMTYKIGKDGALYLTSDGKTTKYTMKKTKGWKKIESDAKTEKAFAEAMDGVF